MDTHEQPQGLRERGDALIAQLRLPEPVIFLRDTLCEYRWEPCLLYILPASVLALRMTSGGYITCCPRELRNLLPTCACGCGKHGNKQCDLCDTPRREGSCLQEIKIPPFALSPDVRDKSQNMCAKCAYSLYENERGHFVALSDLVTVITSYDECCYHYPGSVANFEKLDFPANIKEIIWKYL